MLLTNEQYLNIMREYDSLQEEDREDKSRRSSEVYSAIPQIKEIEDKLASEAVRLTKLALLGKTEDISEVNRLVSSLKAEKTELLKANGFPADYMDMKYKCPLCKDTGYINGTEKCSCFTKRISGLLYAGSNLENILSRENFSTFSFDLYSSDLKDFDPLLKRTPNQNIHHVVDQARLFIENFGSKDAENLLIYGNAGTGKTFLVNCICKELLDKNVNVLYLSSLELFKLLAKYSFSRNKESGDEGMSAILDSELLVIDDLGTEFTNDFTTSQLFYVINERHLRNRSTIISTNLSFDNIKATYSERIFSRLMSYYKLLKIIGKDIRIGS